LPCFFANGASKVTSQNEVRRESSGLPGDFSFGNQMDIRHLKSVLNSSLIHA
jgi:hypothetical protein